MDDPAHSVLLKNNEFAIIFSVVDDGILDARFGYGGDPDADLSPDEKLALAALTGIRVMLTQDFVGLANKGLDYLENQELLEAVQSMETK